MNAVSPKQLYIMIFFIPLVFKMSSLPALMYGEISSSAFLLIGLTAMVEFLQLGIVLFVIKQGGMKGIKEKYGKNAYLAVSIPFLFIIFIKLLILTQEIVHYVCSYLFYNITESAIIPLVLIVTFYLGTRGVRSVGRMFEISIWLIPIIVAFGVFFGEIELEPMYITPIFNESADSYFNTLGKFLIYTFDFSPLLFFDVKVKKASPIVISSLLSVGVIMSCYVLLFSSYGNASMHATFAFARLATFNTVVSEIGSLDWPSVLLWLVTGLLSIALKINAVDRVFEEFRVKKLGTGGFCIGVGIVLLTAVKTLNEAVKLVTSGIQYVVFGLEIVMPLVVLCLLLAKKNNVGENYATQN